MKGLPDPELLIQPIRAAVIQKNGEIAIGIFPGIRSIVYLPASSIAFAIISPIAAGVSATRAPALFKASIFP